MIPASTSVRQFATVAGLLVLVAAFTLPRLSRASAPAPGPTVKFVLATGATVADVTRVTARAVTSEDSAIDKVDFYVDDQLKYSDSSVPYEFDWDTLAETEGPHVVSATATDSKGRTAKARITLTVDNELTKGADALATTALDALKAGDSDKALRYARRALKLDAKNIPAARAYAGVLQSRGEVGAAMAALDKLDLPETDTEMRAQLVSLHVDMADQSNSTEDFIKESGTAVEIFKKLQSIRAAKNQASGDPEGVIASGDAYFEDRQWSKAIAAYQSGTTGATPSVSSSNRLALAYLAAERSRDADTVLHSLQREQRADDVSRVLLALHLLKTFQLDKARLAIQEGVDNRSLAALIIAAYTDLSIGQAARARDEAEQASAIAPDVPAVNLLRSFTVGDTVEARHAMVRALEKNPMLVEAYVERAWQAMVGRDADRFAAADALIEFALKLDPANSYALMAKAVSFIAQKRPNEAEPVLAQLEQTEPTAPDVHMAAGLNYSLLDTEIKVTPELEAAKRLDADHWGDALVPKTNDLLARIYRYRHSPVLGPAALYPPKT